MIYDKREDKRIHAVENLVYGSLRSTEKTKVNLVIADRSQLFSQSAKYAWLATEEFLIKNHNCPTKNCNMSFERSDKFQRHLETCDENIKITTKQRVLGDNQGKLGKCIKLGYLQETMKNFRQKFIVAFDIESFEQTRNEEISTQTTINASCQLVCFAISSNLPGYEDKFFRRSSSEPAAEQELIDNFVKELDVLQKKLVENLPESINQAIERLGGELEELKFGFRKTELKSLHDFLKQYQVLKVFGFNSGNIKYFYQLYL